MQQRQILDPPAGDYGDAVVAVCPGDAEFKCVVSANAEFMRGGLAELQASYVYRLIK